MPAAEALKRARRIAPVVLEAKEGLALINGTQYMAALGTLALLEAERLCTRGRRRGRDEPRGAEGIGASVRRAPPGGAAAPRPGDRREEHARAPRRERDRGEPPGLRQGAGRLLACGACRRCTARRATRSPGCAACSSARSTASPTTRACSCASDGRRRHHQRRELPRPAARARARPRRDGRRRAREHQRAARRAAGQPGAVDGAHAVPRTRAAACTRGS